MTYGSWPARVRTAQEQRWWNAAFATAGVFVGAALWYVLPSVLPFSIGDQLAASLIGGSPWQAGQTLMQRASPEPFDKMVQLYNAVGDQQTEVCARDIAMAHAERALDEARAAGRRPKHRKGDKAHYDALSWTSGEQAGGRGSQALVRRRSADFRSDLEVTAA